MEKNEEREFTAEEMMGDTDFWEWIEEEMVSFCIEENAELS